MSKTNFLVLQEIIIYKIENLIKKKQQKKNNKKQEKTLIKENKSHKSIFRIVCKGKRWISAVLLLF